MLTFPGFSRSSANHLVTWSYL